MFAVYYSLFLLIPCVLVLGSPSWPKGKYALLKPTTGCPDGWYGKGWLLQDTEDTNPSNNRSQVLNIDGYVSPSYVIRSFCVKTGGDQALSNVNWPNGSYCIYKKKGESLLSGMSAGRIEMYYDTARCISYQNLVTYSSKRKHDIMLFFQCKTDRSTKVPIELPITKSFYLLPYGSRDCQQVKWMVATTEWIKYDLNNNNNNNPSDIVSSGTRPFFSITKDSSNNEDITMYYCHYQSCNYTLTEKTGVFQSPGFPGKYPDGQLCSWKIMVPLNHTIHLRFTNFSLFGNDNKDILKFYKKVNGSFPLHHTFYGNKQPFTLTATSEVLFVFSTNEKSSSNGFRAEYTVFKKTTPETSSSPITTLATSPITGSLHKTTTQTNKEPNNSTASSFKKSRLDECNETGTTIAIVIPLICVIVVLVVITVIFYRRRSKEPKCEKCLSSRYTNEDVINPTYDRGNIQIHQRTSTVTMNTTMGEEDNDGQMYQALSRDQQPEYESPDYSKQNGTVDPNMDPGYPEYHELEPMDNNVPDVVYDVLEGPHPTGTPDDQTYQTLDRKTTDNPLYQSANPATMVTRNRLYVDSVA